MRSILYSSTDQPTQGTRPMMALGFGAALVWPCFPVGGGWRPARGVVLSIIEVDIRLFGSKEGLLVYNKTPRLPPNLPLFQSASEKIF
ncbi:hypothetical protein V496_03248 [Pseudogymnoascus sp. VKM F-4515 (FW-2607)]|nr:hypothetical protein V496_03248 [Pseudogymnoascus sp. VKM F-4515 (FW-2607)]